MSNFKKNIIDFLKKKNEKKISEEETPLISFLYEVMDKHGVDRDQLTTMSVDEALEDEVNPGHSEYYRSLIKAKNRRR